MNAEYTIKIYISEKYGFLQDRQIHDSVAIAQECMHLIHTKHINAAIMKVDLQKMYDFVDWGYLRLVLCKIGLQPRCVNWVMACVLNINYAIIINGYPTHFFRAGRGLRQHYSLSPLLFILVMDNLSLRIKKAVEEDQFQALVMGINNQISHGFFVDDVLIMGMLNRLSWMNLFHIFKKFEIVFGLVMNLQKSM